MRYSSKSVLFIFFTLFTFVSYAQNLINEEDRAIAEMAKELREQSVKWTLPTNPHAAEAKRQAAELVADHNNGMKPTMNIDDRPKLAGRTIIFASMSLGGESLEDILYQSSIGDGVIVAFRGVVDEKNFAKEIFSIQELAARQSPVANVVIDPTLFRDFNVTTVPTVVYLDEERSIEVGRVEGLSSPQWLLRRIEEGKNGDFGVRGPVSEIAERDLIEVMKEKVAGIDWAEKKESAIKNYWSKQQFIRLPSATSPSTRLIDPSIQITADIKDAEGNVLVHQGTLINPLKLRPFTQAVVIFDPLSNRELELVEARLTTLKEQYTTITLIVTQFDHLKGWDSYKEITDRFESPVFNLTSDIHQRFDIQRTPSIVTAENEYFKVEELAVIEEME